MPLFTRFLMLALLACSLLSAGSGTAYAATAKEPTWRELPLACLPERAIPWDMRNDTETDQAACHCPPAADCPTTVWPQSKQWPASNILPPDMVQRCCPRPVCPKGTTLADLPIPSDGNCDGCRVTVPPKPVQPEVSEDLKKGFDAHGGQSGFKAHCDGLPDATAKQAAGCHHLTNYIQAQNDYTKALKSYNEAVLLETQRIKWEETVWTQCQRNSGWCTSSTRRRAYDGCSCARGYNRVGDTCRMTFRTETGGSCFIAGTKVTMADGTKKAIELLSVGDVVKGQGGDNRVTFVETPTLSGRDLYSINGSKAFVTHEHPFMTLDGWKSINPDATALENAMLKVKPLNVGDVLITESGKVKITSIEAATADAATVVYNPMLDGDHTYFADTYLVHNKEKSDCMRSDSLVQLENGKKIAIGSIKVGDKLMGPNGVVEVVQTNHLGARHAEYFRINDLEMAITGNHPILTTEGWKSTDDVGRDITQIVGRLEVGDELLSADGKTTKVTSITRIDTKEAPEEAVNIATKDDAPFYVDGVAVKPFRAIEFKY